MLNRGFFKGTCRVAALTLALAATSAAPAFAKGGDDNHGSTPGCSRGHDGGDDDGDGDDRGGGGDHLFCPNHQVLVRIDDKICPDKPGRPAVVRKRVCCRHGTLTNCHPFRPCPPRSAS